MASKELFHLLRVLDDRNTGLRRDDIAWAFEAPQKAATEAWTREHLSPHTLLSKEEQIFHEHVGRDLPKSTRATTSRPLSEEDFEHAITSLESSTVAIEKQCRLLEAQKRALQTLQARKNASTTETEDGNARRAQKLAREQAQLDLELEQVSSGLQRRLRGSLKQSESAVAKFPASVQRLLERDDGVLDGLQKVAPQLESADDVASLAHVDGLCRAFAVLEARAIRARIDATYRRHDIDRAGRGESATDDQQEALLTELEELRSEIDGLVSLVADNYYKGPISQGLQTARIETQDRASRWSEYRAATLRYLAGRLETLDEHVQHVHAQRMALAAAAVALEETLAVTPRGRSEGQDVTSTVAKKTPQKKQGLKPLRLVQENISEVVDPTALLLQQLDVRNHGEVKDAEKLGRLLREVRRERRDRLGGIEASVEEQTTRELVRSLHDADGNGRELWGAVFAYTGYNTRKLGHEAVAELVEDLEGRTQELGERMRGVDWDGMVGEVKRAQGRVLGAPIEGVRGR